MLIETLKSLFNRDLNQLKGEIELYQNESQIWHIQKGIANSAGNLCLHLLGNLNIYIGAQLGETGYIRYREFEFSSKDISKAELILKIEDAKIMVQNTLKSLKVQDLQLDYPKWCFQRNFDRVFVDSSLNTFDISSWSDKLS